MIDLNWKETLRKIVFSKKELDYKLIKNFKNQESFLLDKMDVSKSKEIT